MPVSSLAEKTHTPFRADEIADRLIACFNSATRLETPYTHWFLSDTLPVEVGNALAALPIKPPEVTDTMGRRETYNSLRKFFSPEIQKLFPVCGAVAEAFQSAPVIRTIESLCGISLKGSYLRIEYCQDREGFWLEPHTDIDIKRFTMQVHFNTGVDAATLGTDVYDGEQKPHSRSPSRFNEGMIFIPAHDTWHGFERRPIADIRKSLIINYVSPGWRARHELAFPDDLIA